MNERIPAVSTTEPQPLFDYTAALLQSRQHEIIDMSRARATLETAYVCYSIVETNGSQYDAAQIYGDFADATRKRKKDFVVVAFHLDAPTIAQIDDYINDPAVYEFNGVVAASELQLERIMTGLERPRPFSVSRFIRACFRG